MEAPAGISGVQLDFLRELMNVGSGNAVSALARMLRRPVAMEMPHLYPWPSAGPPFLLEPAAVPMTCATMRMVGDVQGALLFVVPEADRGPLAVLLADAPQGPTGRTGRAGATAAADDTPIRDLADITAGVFLTAIHRFCGVVARHTTPDIDSARGGMVLEKAFAATGRRDPPGLLMEASFTVSEGPVRLHLLMVPRPEGVDRLADAIRAARALCAG